MEVVLDGISPSSFGTTSWSFPAMNAWYEVIVTSHRGGGGGMACCGDVRTSIGGMRIQEQTTWVVNECWDLYERG